MVNIFFRAYHIIAFSKQIVIIKEKRGIESHSINKETIFEQRMLNIFISEFTPFLFKINIS